MVGATIEQVQQSMESNETQPFKLTTLLQARLKSGGCKKTAKSLNHDMTKNGAQLEEILRKFVKDANSDTPKKEVITKVKSNEVTVVIVSDDDNEPEQNSKEELVTPKKSKDSKSPASSKKKKSKEEKKAKKRLSLQKEMKSDKSEQPETKNEEDDDAKPSESDYKQKSNETPAKSPGIAANGAHDQDVKDSAMNENTTEKEGHDVTEAENTDNSRKRRRSSQGGTPRQGPTPFKRIREEKVTFEDDKLRDNTFFSKADSYGVKAHNDLVVTRGKGFRKEKTKKKKQNHHGGTLNYQVNSFKFSDDSD